MSLGTRSEDDHMSEGAPTPHPIPTRFVPTQVARLEGHPNPPTLLAPAPQPDVTSELE